MNGIEQRTVIHQSNMPSGVVGWHTVPTQHVEYTETGFLAWGIPVPFASVYSPDGEPFPDRYLPRVISLLEEYGAICTAAGATFPIGSLYRSLTHQYQHFYSHRAEHTTARALDILPIDGWTPSRIAVYAMARRRERVSRLGGIGIAPGWVHLEVVPTSHRAVWRWDTNRKAD